MKQTNKIIKSKKPKIKHKKMENKILIAIKENKEMESELSEHFGHCPYFAIYNLENKKLEIINNKLDHSDENLSPVAQIMKFKPSIVFSLGMGNRAIKLFKEQNIQTKTGNYKTLKEVIENINELEDLSNGCSH